MAKGFIKNWFKGKPQKRTSYEIAFSELMTDDRLEFALTRLRQITIVLYAILLSISIDAPILGTTHGYWTVLAIFILLQVISFLVETSFPRFRHHKYKLLRSQGYLILSFVLFFMSGGKDSNLVLVTPYLLFAGLYLQNGWPFIIAIEITCLTGLMYFLLGYFKYEMFTPFYIFLRLFSIIFIGLYSTYLWRRQHLSRKTLIKQDTLFSDVAMQLAVSMEVSHVLEQAPRKIKEIVQADSGIIVTRKEEGNAFEAFASWGYQDKPIFQFNPSFDDSEGLTGWILYHKIPLLISDVRVSDLKPKFPEIATGKELRSYLGVPLLVEQEIIGVLMVTSGIPGQFGEVQKELLSRFARWLAIGLRNAFTFQQLDNTRNYLSQLLDNAPSPMIVANRHGNVERFNAPAVALLDYSSEHLQGKKVEELWGTPEEARLVLNMMREGNGTIQDYEGTIRKADGQKVPILFSGKLVKTSEDKRLASIGSFRKLDDYTVLLTRLDAWEKIDSLIVNSIQHNDLKTLTDIILKGAARILSTDSLHIRLLDDTGNFLDILNVIGPYKHSPRHRKRVGEEVAGTVLKTSRERVCNDTEVDDYTIKALDESEEVFVKEFLQKYLSYMVVPLEFGGKAIGTFHAEAQRKDFFDDKKQQMVWQLANRMTPVIQSANLNLISIYHSDRLEKLARFTSKLIRITSGEDLYHLIVEYGCELVQAEECSLHMVNLFKKRVTMVASKVLPKDMLNEISEPLSGIRISSLPAYVAYTGESKRLMRGEFVNSAFWNDKNKKHENKLPSKMCYSVLSVAIPNLKVDYGNALGVLQVENKRENGLHQAFSIADEEILTIFANEISGIIHQLELRDEVNRNLKQLSLLQEIGAAIQVASSMEEQLWYALIAITINDCLEFNRAFIFLMDRYGEYIRCVCAMGPDDAKQAETIYTDSIWKKETNRQFITELYKRDKAVYENSMLFQDLKKLQFSQTDSKSNILTNMIFGNELDYQVFNLDDLPIDTFVTSLKALKRENDCFALVPVKVQGRTIGVVYVDNKFNDIPLKEGELRLLQLFADQLAANVLSAWTIEEKDQLFHRVAHTFHSPINHLGIYARRLADGEYDNDPTRRKEIAETIARISEVFSTLTIEARYIDPLERLVGSRLVLDWVSIEYFFRSLDEINRFETQARQIKIKKVYPDKNVELYVDRDHMLNCLQMLVDNAIRYSHNQETIILQGYICNNDYFCISVKDNGIGIAPDDKDSVLTRNFRGENAKIKESGRGTGVGLWIVNEIIKAHKTEIYFESELGIGTVFNIRFPPQCWRFEIPQKRRGLLNRWKDSRD